MNPDESPGLSELSPAVPAQGPRAHARTLGSAGWSPGLADSQASTR